MSDVKKPKLTVLMEMVAGESFRFILKIAMTLYSLSYMIFMVTGTEFNSYVTGFGLASFNLALLSLVSQVTIGSIDSDKQEIWVNWSIKIIAGLDAFAIVIGASTHSAEQVNEISNMFATYVIPPLPTVALYLLYEVARHGAASASSIVKFKAAAEKEEIKNTADLLRVTTDAKIEADKIEDECQIASLALAQSAVKRAGERLESTREVLNTETQITMMRMKDKIRREEALDIMGSPEYRDSVRAEIFDALEDGEVEEIEPPKK